MQVAENTQLASIISAQDKNTTLSAGYFSQIGSASV